MSIDPFAIFLEVIGGRKIVVSVHTRWWLVHLTAGLAERVVIILVFSFLLGSIVIDHAFAPFRLILKHTSDEFLPRRFATRAGTLFRIFVV